MSSAEKRSVLLVDDNDATCTLITAILQRDFSVESAHDGLDALEKLRTKQYAAIMLDLRMPPPDGFAILDFLKANNPALLRSVLIVTALLTPKETQRARAYGVCDIISKPFDVDTLLDAVKHCAGDAGPGPRAHGVFCSPVILLIADLLRSGWTR